jgi:hypothetical protein
MLWTFWKYSFAHTLNSIVCLNCYSSVSKCLKLPTKQKTDKTKVVSAYEETANWSCTLFLYRFCTDCALPENGHFLTGRWKWKVVYQLCTDFGKMSTQAVHDAVHDRYTNHTIQYTIKSDFLNCFSEFFVGMSERFSYWVIVVEPLKTFCRSLIYFSFALHTGDN